VSGLVTASVTTEDAETTKLTVYQSDLQQCASVQKLSALRVAIEEKESPIMRQVFAWLFPFGPAWNSSTYAAYAFPHVDTTSGNVQFSGHSTSARSYGFQTLRSAHKLFFGHFLEFSRIPNFILAFIPAEINRDTLNTMTAFATGGLLSDVFLHLVPHSFMGEQQEPGIQLVVVEEKRNILIG
jgi:zinc transporter 7